MISSKRSVLVFLLCIPTLVHVGLAQAMRDIFQKFEKIAPEFVSWLEDNVDEGLRGEGSEPSTMGQRSCFKPLRTRNW